MRPEPDDVRIRRQLQAMHARREQARQMVVDGIALEMECDDVMRQLIDLLPVQNPA